ncbi:hypothetical protein CSB09_01095 [Candidatus Gracilibacteria bacterium]|nr:MAG: hypothetical protein CSB09_01095 [Candidatus Gracilibacteria bacterium]
MFSEKKRNIFLKSFFVYNTKNQHFKIKKIVEYELEKVKNENRFLSESQKHCTKKYKIIKFFSLFSSFLAI